MIEQLFGSATRVKLLRLFLTNQSQAYFVREITRKLGLRINAVRQELQNLFQLDILTTFDRDGKKYYQANADFLLFPELKSLIIKAQLTIERDLVEQLKAIGTVKYLVLTGRFTNAPETATDMLLVGKFNRKKLEPLLKEFASHFDFDINYTILTTTEFLYRKGLTDRFLFSILENKKIVVIDALQTPGS